MSVGLDELDLALLAGLREISGRRAARRATMTVLDGGGGAMARYRRDRDPAALEATMAALDRQEAATRAAQDIDTQPAADVVAYLRDLPRWWAEAPVSRRGLAEALFERIDVLGLRQMHLEPTQLAIRAGLVEAFASSSAGYGRGERTSARASRQINGCRVTIGGPPPEPVPLEQFA